jgi:DNA-directed RNA polymerase subunit K/omega
MDMLTKFEFAEVVATRAALVEKGAKPLVSVTPAMTCVDIAVEELRSALLDAVVIRQSPDGSVRRVCVKEALLPFEVYDL